jgi:hypothetical protein
MEDGRAFAAGVGSEIGDRTFEKDQANQTLDRTPGLRPVAGHLVDISWEVGLTPPLSTILALTSTYIFNYFR